MGERVGQTRASTLPFPVKRVVGAAIGVLVGLGFALLCPDVGLSQQGVRCLAILMGAIVWWIAGVLPEYATGILMVVLFYVCAGVGFEVSMSAFASSTWWLLVAAFSLGASMKACGLMKRMALAIVHAFPTSFRAQTAGLVAVGTLLGPLIPSLSAKTSIIAPIALAIGDGLGYERKGRQMQGMFLAMFTGIRTIGPAVISSSILGYALLALYPADVCAQFDMLHWFIAALPWFLIVSALNYVALQVFYGKGANDVGRGREPVPADGGHDPKGPAGGSGNRPSAEELGPMSAHEKQMLVIILLTVAAWVLEPLHGVPAHIVALVAMCATVACGILDKQTFKTGINWEPLVFMGTVFGLSSVFALAGIGEWVVGACGPLFEALTSNSYLFVIGIGLSTVALRFLIVSEMAYINIVMVFLVPLALSCGINPWVVGMAIFTMVNPWFVLYQNPVYLAGFYAVDGQMGDHADIAKYCLPYTLFCLTGLVASVPYWQWMGLLP